MTDTRQLALSILSMTPIYTSVIPQGARTHSGGIPPKCKKVKNSGSKVQRSAEQLPMSIVDIIDEIDYLVCKLVNLVARPRKFNPETIMRLNRRRLFS